MLHRLKTFVPPTWILGYHRALSWFAATWYGYPSREMLVIGVTGTNGKTTTSYFIAKALEASGFPTGCTTTALFKIGTREWLNDRKMTMLGRFQLQKMLRDMVNAGCRYAVVETSSQGIIQFRHSGINYDVAVCTNLTPEHIEAHGGFEKYKQAKIELFRHVARSPRKVFNGKTIPKSAILNAGDPHAVDFAVAGFDQIAWYGVENPQHVPGLFASSIEETSQGVQFTMGSRQVHLRVSGKVNVENALAALAVAQGFAIDVAEAAMHLESIMVVPGRFERIEEGQSWTTIVDYAPEPASLAKLYESVMTLPHQRIIHVLGSCGGGRDVVRRPILGRMAAKYADIIVVTNEDPYDDDPKQIMEQVAAGAREFKKENQKLLVIEDRREAIFEAMRQAQPGDLVLLTGKGSEQAMCVANGKMIPWDERQVAREAIREVMKKKKNI